MSALPLHEQFDDPAQQRHAATLGMWLFLATEALVFSVLFTAYTAARAAYPQAFHEAGHHLYKWIGVGNAAVLLLSSAAMAIAVETPSNRPGRRSAGMLATAVLGIVFLGIKAIEYTLDVHESLLPLVRFDAARFTQPAHSELFLVFYWIITGLHALHVLGGVVVIGPLALRIRSAVEPERLDNTIHSAGLYWHFVDIVWLFILPILYLSP